MTEKIYLPYQVSMLMPGDMHKTMVALFASQKDGVISYSKRNCDFLHLDQAIVEQAIQTAIDHKLITPVEQSGGVYRFKIIQPTIEAAKMTSVTDIPNKPLLRLSTDITFKQMNNTKPMTPEEILGQIEALKRQLMTKVKAEQNNDADTLPW